LLLLNNGAIMVIVVVIEFFFFNLTFLINSLTLLPTFAVLPNFTE
jgi:hypothetical protein